MNSESNQKILEAITLGSAFLYFAGYAFNTGYFFDYRSQGLFLIEFADIIGTILSYEFHVSLLVCMLICGTFVVAAANKNKRISIPCYIVSSTAATLVAYKSGSDTGYSLGWSDNSDALYAIQVFYAFLPWAVATLILSKNKGFYVKRWGVLKSFVILNLVAILAFVPAGNLWFKHQALSVSYITLTDKTVLKLRAATFINKGIIAFDRYNKTVLIPKEEIRLVSIQYTSRCERFLFVILNKDITAEDLKTKYKFTKKEVDECILTRL